VLVVTANASTAPPTMKIRLRVSQVTMEGVYPRHRGCIHPTGADIHPVSGD
jgi:hypothetical protein